MTDQLSTLQLQNKLDKYKDCFRKQKESILELSCLVEEINNKLYEVDSSYKKADLIDLVDHLKALIKLKVKRAQNYLYIPER
jgi:hypothetical protein